MEDKKQDKLFPGDIGYPGGETTSTVFIDGKCMNARVIKDANGNITYLGLTEKIFGIF